MTTAIDPAFAGVGQKAGVEIWRIEKFKPVHYPKSEFGKFYDGDSYIVLKTKERNGVLSWDIHFWLGKNTTQDEKGCAAIKSVELDESLGGLPVQHRETQEYESTEFLSYFPGGVRYVPGGVESGFKTYDPLSAPNRLFHVKGKRNVRVREVELNVRSMNKGDCFILDTPTKIYVYVGRYSKRVERLKAIQAANQIRDQDHGGRVKVIVVEPSTNEEEVSRFFKALGGGSRADLPDPPAEDDDDTFEKLAETTVTLYRVSDQSGSLKVDKVATRPLSREMLKTEDCFILDCGKSGLFVWIGKKCTKEEKNHSIKVAEKFLKENGYPDWTKIQRIVDGGEPTAFKQYFQIWKESNEVGVLGKTFTLEKIAATSSFVTPKIRDVEGDREKLRKFIKNMGRAVGFCPDDGKGKTQLWRIENFELAPVPSDKHGLFFGGDSYVLKYSYKEKSGRESYILYFWQGLNSSQDEKAAAALHTIKLDDELHGRAVQVRVTQGNEPAHFLRVFKGKMVIFRGGHASGFKNVRQHDTYDPKGTKLFQIQGTCDDDTRAIEIEPKASNLDSDDVFVVDAPGITYIWVGKGASEDEKRMSKNVDKIVSPDRDGKVINEGSEPAEFWKLLGGKVEYNKQVFQNEAPRLLARLFHCSITPPSKKLLVEEVFNFDQEDLNEDDVMVLDTGSDEIFIWIGKGATKDEKQNSLTMADEYIKAQHQRAGGNAVSVSIIVKQGDEPESFKVLFPAWNDEFWN